MTEKLTGPPRLIDVATALEKRGRQEEADYYGAIYPQMISMIYGLSVDDLLHMSIEEISKLEVPPEKPLKYEGWNFWHGRAAFGDRG